MEFPLPVQPELEEFFVLGAALAAQYGERAGQVLSQPVPHLSRKGQIGRGELQIHTSPGRVTV